MYGCNVLVIPAVFLSPESPSWLIRMGKKKEAFKILKRVANSRGIPLEEDDFLNRIAATDEELANREREDGASKDKGWSETDIMLFEKNNNFVKPSNNNNLNIANEIPANGGATDDEAHKAPAAGSHVAAPTSTLFREAIRSKYLVILVLIGGLYWSFFNFIYIGITFSYDSLPGNRWVFMVVWLKNRHACI